MELQAEHFYIKAAEQAEDVGVRRLLGDLAEEEKGHEKLAVKLTDEILSPDVRAEEDKTRRRMFVLQYVQPGLAGLMDGSVSTLAPLFAAAFATHQNWQTFLVGLAASIGAGISMGFAEALSDDGSLTGRGSPWLRGAACGIMTALGGLGHTLPYLVPDTWPNAFWIATAIAGIVVFFELWAIAYHSRALHGHAVPAGGVPDRARRRHRARGRDIDRRGVARPQLRSSARLRRIISDRVHDEMAARTMIWRAVRIALAARAQTEHHPRRIKNRPGARLGQVAMEFQDRR